MSTYEYFEFIAVERPLSNAEVAELRAASSRATITSNAFVNEYHFGNFKGNARDWLGRFFDAHVHSASWGACDLTLALPGETWSDEVLAPFVEGGIGTGWTPAFRIERRGDKLLLTWAFTEDDVDDERFWNEGDGPGWAARLLPLRDELLRGDPRPLYLGWLARWNRGEIETATGEADDVCEPPLPAGLGALTPAQEALVEFAMIDVDLLGSAAAASAPLPRAGGEDRALEHWLEQRSADELRDVARLLLAGRGAAAERSLRRAWLASVDEPDASATSLRRTVSMIEAGVEAIRDQRIDAERQERERIEQRGAAERARYLVSVAKRADAQWTLIDAELERGIANAYDTALVSLRDLHDALEVASRGAEYHARFDVLMERHGRRPAWLRRLRNAGLIAGR